MEINEIIMIIMAIFLCLGLLDKCINNKFGLGEEVDKAFALIPLLVFALVGVISLAPILAVVLEPVITPLYKSIGADPSMFVASFLASDAGGYFIIRELGESQDIINFAGFIVGVCVGPTITFSIPVMMSILIKEDHKYAAIAILGAIIPAPIGCFIGGIVAGFSPDMLFWNLVPIVILAVLLCLGLALMPNKLVKGFSYFAKFITFLTLCSLAIAAFQTLTGVEFIKGMIPMSTGFGVVGYMALIVGGSFPLLFVINKFFAKQIAAVAKFLKINNVAASGLLISFSHAVPAFGTVKDMNPRGKVLVLSFAVSFAYIIGSHLGFTATMNREMVIPMMTAKAISGILGVIIALFIAGRIYPECRKL